MHVHVQEIQENWSWKECDSLAILDVSDNSSSGWTAVHSFPSEIHVELMQQGRIPDPYIGFNEHQVQWVGEREWLYKCAFPYNKSNLDYQFAQLQFDGLDTFCEVYLNGVKVLEADNMFRSYNVTLDKGTLRESNSLLLHFKSAQKIAKALESQFGRVRAGSANLGDPSRVYVRKAQYDWRWDWGPELMTCGPYRPIRLLAYVARIASVNVCARVSPAPALNTSLKVDLSLTGDLRAAHAVQISLRSASNGCTLHTEKVQLAIADLEKPECNVLGLVHHDLHGDVNLWWPTGYGSQSLYDVEVSLLNYDGTALDEITKRVGFRRVELVQDPLQEPDQHGTGTTFLFEVNGVRMFMGGSNWIPADNFLTTISSERYRAWLTLLKDGNQNMVRLWGGGIYEPDIFYDTCDELGILVWQDFQFACGVYPAHAAFVASVKAEAEDNIKRLRHHPCLALFCGNNEDYQQVLQWGDVPDLPARILYESILPSAVTEFTDPPIPYHRGSPYGGSGWDTADPTIGDVHQWNVWAGKENPWQNYGTLGGRFVSEFGIPSMPDIRTVDYWLAGNNTERWAQSKLMAQHNRAGSHERRFAIVMNENFRLTSDLETHVYNTQIMQSEAISLAYRMWRREWKGKGKEYCAGVLVWQLNDCWPVTSWAIADYFLRPKPAYFTIARELRTITVGIFRTVIKNRDNDRPVQFYEFGAFQSVEATIEVWGNNSSLSAREASLELYCVDLGSHWSHKEVHEVILQPNQSTELLSIRCPAPPLSSGEEHLSEPSHSVVVAARIFDTETGEVLARYVDWPQPYRHVDFPVHPGLRVHVSGNKISIEADKPVKGLVLSADGDGEEVKWSDNALDIMPGDVQIVTATSLNGRWLKVAYMGQEKATRV